MNYICEITTPSKLFGEQVEVTEKDALLCAESFGKRENAVGSSFRRRKVRKTCEKTRYGA